MCAADTLRQSVYVNASATIMTPTQTRAHLPHGDAKRKNVAFFPVNEIRPRERARQPTMRCKGDDYDTTTTTAEVALR